MKKQYLKPTTAIVKIDAEPILAVSDTVIGIPNGNIESNEDIGGNQWNRSKDNVWDDDEEDW